MDSHTPMTNALGIVGWGVGGIEAGASMLAPEVIGVELLGINQTRLLRILM